MFLKKSLHILKEKFYPLFFSELIFLFATFFFLVFAKNKLAVYVLRIQEYSASAAAIQQGAEQAQLTSFLEGFQSITTNAIWFAYVIIPLVLALIWITTQTWFWYTLQRQKIKNTKKYLLISVIGQISILLLLYLEILFIPVQFSIFDSTDVAILKTIIGVILFFIMFLFLISLEKQSVKAIMKELLHKMKKSYKVLLLFVLLCVSFSGMAFLFFSLFTTYMTGTIVLFSVVPMVLYLVVMMVLFIWLKVIFSIKA